MMLFPGISQVQSALIGMAAGVLLAGVGASVLTHKLDNGRYEALVAAQATAHSEAISDDLKAKVAFDTRLAAANGKAFALQTQLDAERDKKQTVLVKTMQIEGKKDATLAACFSHKLPADVLRNFAH